MNIDTYLDAVASLGLFDCFTRDELSDFFALPEYEIKQYKKGQLIHIQNEICNTMDIILSGRVAVQNMDVNGNVLTINIFSAKDIVGVNLMFSQSNRYPMIVICESDAIVLHMNKELILKLGQKNVGFMIALMQAISDRTLILTQKISSISLKNIRQRIIDFLEYECHMQKSRKIKLNITKKELAERMGIQRSSLSRELNKMRRDGLVEYDARTVTLKNIDTTTD